MGSGSLVLLGGAAEISKRLSKRAAFSILDATRSFSANMVDTDDNILGGKFSSFNILHGSISPQVMKLMTSSKFIELFGGANHEKYINKRYIGYRIHADYLEYERIVDSVSECWMLEFLSNTPREFKDRFVSAMYEVFANAYGHALRSSNMPVISCTHIDEKEKVLRVSVLDLGGGVCAKVRELRSDVSGDDVAILKWALARGNSTRTDSDTFIPGIPRGMGLFLLSRFVASVGATACIYSNSACAEIAADGVSVHMMAKSNIPGTFIDISVPIDNAYGVISSSVSSKRYL
jgi:anti-sigma regulatory factor (Ser/Thr protein kinase)